jgi:RNA ligase (TIGR02306 family)
MSKFDVTVRRLDDVLPHPNADRLDLAVVGGYRCVVARGQFAPGDLVAYLPEAALLPPSLATELGLEGKLAGPEANRIHPVRLRGALSQGVVMPARAHWRLGDSVMDELGVTKFVPQIPAELSGDAYVLEEHERLDFDIENLKAFPTLFADGDDVVFTEKVHGVFMAVGGLPTNLARPEHLGGGRGYVSSKGLLCDRMAFCGTVANVYVRAGQALVERVAALAQDWGVPVLVLGELFGLGVQDLAYGVPAQAAQFRAFAVVRRDAQGQPQYLDDAELDSVLARLDITRVPVLYRGPYSAQVVAEYTSGKEAVSGQQVHLREGVVITPAVERAVPSIGRLVLKSVSEDYLLRKGGTEYT